mgnify:CR=1 FL=1
MQDRNYIVPFGYFIINRAEVDFYLELVDSDLHSGNRKHLRLAVSKIDVEPEDTYFANGVLVHNIVNEKEYYL